MSFIKVMIHAVWGTKNRERILVEKPRILLIKHIIENAEKKNIYIDTINGEADHIHCLFDLRADLCIKDALQLIKGESSSWFNKQNLINHKLYWADEYFAASVSQSQINKVRNYIRNQLEHHKIITFQDEYDKFLTAYKLKG